MRRALRWLKRIVLATLALAVLAVIVVLIALHTDWGRELLRRKVEAALASSFPGGAHVGRLEGSVFGELVVRDLELDAPDHEPMLTVGTAKIELGLLPLARKTARIDRLVLDDVAVALREQAPQPAAAPSQEPSSPPTWSVVLDRVEIHRAKISIERGATPIEVHDIEIGAVVDAPAGGAITALAALRGTWRTTPVSAALAVRYQNGVVTAPLLVADGGGAHLLAVGVRADEHATVEGSFAATVPAATALALAQIELPGDLAFTLDARRGQIGELAATLGPDRSVRAKIAIDLAARAARGVVIADDADARIATRGALVGPAQLVAAVDVGLDHVRGILVADGATARRLAVRGQSPTVPVRLAAAVSVSSAGGWVFLRGGTQDAEARGTWVAKLARVKGKFSLVEGTLIAHARNIDAVAGVLDARLHVTGQVWPTPELSVSGDVDGGGLAYGTITAEAIHVRLSSIQHIPAHPIGRVEIAVDTARSGGVLIGSGGLDLNAGFVQPGLITIELGEHHFTTGVGAAGATWAGAGGRIDVTPRTIDLRGLQTTSGASRVVASANVTRATGDLSATIEAHDVALATVAGTPGTLGGALAISRRGGRWSGGGTLEAHGLVIADQSLDVDGGLEIAGRRITLHGTAAGPIGAVAIGVDLDGPPDLTSAAAWRRLDRRALRDATLTITHVDAGKIGGAGAIDGELALTATDAHGTVHFHDIHTRSGDIAADVTLGLSPVHELSLGFATTIAGITGVDGSAELALPAHLFDPAEWRALGRDTLRGARFGIKNLAFDPAMFAKLGLTAPWIGRLDVDVTVATGGASATGAIDVHDLHGGPLVRPIDLHATADLDNSGVRGAATVSANATTLVSVSGHTLLTVDRLRARTARYAPVVATITIPTLSARDLLAIFGRSDVTAGTVSGSVDVAGTLGTPTLGAKIAALGIVVPASVGGRAPSKLDDLAITASWGGVGGKLDMIGHEAGGGTLHLAAAGRPDVAASLIATLDAKKFDLAPVFALAPGPLVAARGTLDASLELRGLDPQAGDVRGTLHVSNGRVPLASMIGTFRKADLDVRIADHRVTAKLAGKLGNGDISGNATLALVGGSPTTADATFALRKVSPIGAIEPIIDADITAGFKRAGSKWTGNVAVKNGHIVIPPNEGTKLLPAGAPPDMTFVDAPPRPPTLMHRPPPSDPWLVAQVAIQTTVIEANIRDLVEGEGAISGNLTVSYGAGAIGYDGVIDTERGDVELFGHRYEIDHGSLAFDGTLDPLLNIRLIHDFTDLTLTADISGRASDPEPNLSSDPAIYTQGQLFGFFAGGEPGGDPASQTREAAAGATTSLLSAQVKKRINKYSPVKVEVIDYEAATSTSSAATRIGGWLWPNKLFVAWRQHLEARPDENSEEGEMEYYLFKNWILQGTVGDREYDGADLLHRWRW